ncbi:DUF1835 domain-containing protein [Clostridium sp. BJN0001]|uniref:DUF1835 domain-containing protein n=1 Tax=Clostridium sp. BJN0001 TaxID=2930219 RepID=UPI001FD4D756|nr:DUF1835 domain-containing protein [Clostridium sp. BJN0001]
MSEIVHICFSQSAKGSLKYAINKKIIEGNKVISLYDDISQGPIKCNVDVEKRIYWLKETINKDEYYYESIEEIKKNYMEFQKNISALEDTDTIYFWYGQNAIEICGLMYALELLKDKWKNVYLINVCDMPMKVKYGIYIPRCTSEIIPEKFNEYIKINRKIDKDEYIKLLTEWETLKKEDSVLRIFKDGKIRNVNEDYFDIFILQYTSKELKKSARTIGNVLGNSKILISDEYIFWRVKKLIKSSMINYKGKFNVMREMEISITNKGLEYLKKDNDAIKFWEKREKDIEDKEENIKEYMNMGRLEERVSIAKKLLDVLEVNVIAEKTGLTIGQVRNLMK